MKKQSFIFTLLVFATSVFSFGQTAKTRSALYTEVSSQYPDNTSRAITPAILRSVTNNVIASSYNQLTDGVPITAATAALTYQPIINAGTTSQFWRGDKTWQTLDKTAVGLANVDNTSDTAKPISTATQAALNGKQDTINSGTTLNIAGLNVPTGGIADAAIADTIARDSEVTAAIAAAVSGISSGSLPVGMRVDLVTGITPPSTFLLADGSNGTPNINAGTTVATGTTAYIQGNGTVATPTVNVVAGTYPSTQTVTVSTDTSGATIRHTTNGDAVTESSTVLSGPLTLTTTTRVRARAFRSLYTGSAEFDGTYTISGGGSYLLSDDLVYASTGAATSAGWTSTGVTWNYSTSPAPLGGLASSLMCNWGTATARTFTASGDVWIYFLFNPAAAAATSDVLKIKNAGGTTLLRLAISEGGTGTMTLAATDGGSPAATTTYTVAQTIHVWLHYAKGTGSDGLIEIFSSTTGTKGAAKASVNYGPQTTDAASIEFQCVNDATFIFNKLRISTSSIGDNPS